jgi:hypothetical protein
MAMRSPPPPAQGMDARSYYIELVNQGFSNEQAYQAVQQSYGPPRSPQQQAKDKAKGDQTSAIAGAGGTVAGAIGGKIVIDKAGKWWDAQTGTEVSADVANSGMKTSGTIGVSRPVPPPTTTVDGSGAAVDLGGGSKPQVISSEGGMSTIKTPTGGTQQVPTESLNDSGFWNSVDWGKVTQGGLALAQLYSAYRSYKSGDKVGAGIQGAAGAANAAVATGAASQTGAIGTYAIPGLNLAAGGYGAYQTAKATGSMAAGKQRDIGAGLSGGMAGLSIGLGAAGLAAAAGGAAAGAMAGSVVPVVGTIIGAAAGYFGSKYAGSKKDKGQVRRDMIRGALKERGVLDDNWDGTLADGSKTNFGVDGKKLNTKAMNKLQSENPNAYEPTLQLGDALAASYGFMGDNGRSVARIYVKGALSNAQDNSDTAIANMRHFAKQQGITYDLIKSNLDEALSKNRIDQGGYNRILSSAQQLVPTGTTAPVTKPKKGEVVRTSPGMYMNDKGVVKPAKTVRAALEKFYTQPKEKEDGKKVSAF